MAKSPNELAEAARKAAEGAMPGWRAVKAPTASKDAPYGTESDAQGADLEALRRRYLGAAPSDGPRAPTSSQDAEWVVMSPRRDRGNDSPLKERKVIVSPGGKIAGAQG